MMLDKLTTKLILFNYMNLTKAYNFNYFQLIYI